MKTHLKSKLVVIALLPFTFTSCESEANPEKVTPQQTKAKHTSPLGQQIQFMLEGKPHDEVILKAEVTKQEWKLTFEILKKELEQYSKLHGKRPDKALISRSYARLKKMNSDHERKKSLLNLEKAIQEAVEEEKEKKSKR